MRQCTDAAALHLAVDSVGTRHGGASAVLHEVVAALLARPEVARLTIFASQVIPDCADPRVTVEVHGWSSIQWLRPMWHWPGVARAAYRCAADVLVCLGNGGIGPRRVPTLVFVQQALPFSPEALRTLGVADRLRMAVVRMDMHVSVRLADAVFVQTKAMKDNVVKAFCVPPQRVQMLSTNTIDLPATSAATVDLSSLLEGNDGPRLLYVGNGSAYKNLTRLGQGFVKLREICPQATLFLCGHCRGAMPPGPGIIYLGYVPRSLLRSVYEQVDALVMPSLAESAGLPLMEARSVGLPIAAADRPYAREACGDDAIYFDPLSIEAMADALRRVIRQKRRSVAEGIAPQGQAYGAVAAMAVHLGCRPGARVQPSPSSAPSGKVS